MPSGNRGLPLPALPDAPPSGLSPASTAFHFRKSTHKHHTHFKVFAPLESKEFEVPACQRAPACAAHQADGH